MKNFWQEFCAKWGLGEQERRRAPLLLAALLLGLGLMAVGSLCGGQVDDAADVVDMVAEPAEVGSADGEAAAIEERLAAVLGQVDGAGQVSVVVTLASLGRTEYAADVSSTNRSSSKQDGDVMGTEQEQQLSSDTVLVGGSAGQPLIVESGLPQVQGVLVVAEGAGDAVVCRALTDAVVGLLDVPAHRVVVCRRQQ